MKRLALALAAAGLLAAPLAAQRLGARTEPPSAHQPAPGDDLDALVAAAAAHPLGSAENPVRVGGPEGEAAYVGRLRCPDGARPAVGARAEAGVGGYGSILTAVSLTCAPAAPARVHFDIYHAEHDETRAPDGFRLEG